MYVSEIKDAAQILRLPVTERGVMDNIVSGPVSYTHLDVYKRQSLRNMEVK